MMHKLGSYTGKERIEECRQELIAALEKMKAEPVPAKRTGLRATVRMLETELCHDQKVLHFTLWNLEHDWEEYPDQEALQQYYNELVELYILAGGHWAAKKETGRVYEATHTARDEALPAEPRTRGRSKLFKT